MLAFTAFGDHQPILLYTWDAASKPLERTDSSAPDESKDVHEYVQRVKESRSSARSASPVKDIFTEALKAHKTSLVDLAHTNRIKFEDIKEPAADSIKIGEHKLAQSDTESSHARKAKSVDFSSEPELAKPPMHRSFAERRSLKKVVVTSSDDDSGRDDAPRQRHKISASSTHRASSPIRSPHPKMSAIYANAKPFLDDDEVMSPSKTYSKASLRS